MYMSVICRSQLIQIDYSCNSFFSSSYVLFSEIEILLFFLILEKISFNFFPEQVERCNLLGRFCQVIPYWNTFVFYWVFFVVGACLSFVNVSGWSCVVSVNVFVQTKEIFERWWKHIVEVTERKQGLWLHCLCRLEVKLIVLWKVD